MGGVCVKETKRESAFVFWLRFLKNQYGYSSNRSWVSEYILKVEPIVFTDGLGTECGRVELRTFLDQGAKTMLLSTEGRFQVK